MIRQLLSPSPAMAVFAVSELPVEVQEPIILNLVNPRVISWSMKPTLRPGDRLDLEPAHALQIGDVIVFRQQTLFVCHRIERIERQRLYTRGDADNGPGEAIEISDVVGRVTALARGGRRLSVPAPPALPLRTANPFGAIREPLRSVARVCFTWLLALPLIRRGMIRLTTGLTTVDLLEEAPVRAFPSYIKRGSARLACIAELGTHLTDMNTGRAALMIRIGPLFLGTARLSPWTLHLRPLASALDVESSMQALRSLVENRRDLEP